MGQNKKQPKLWHVNSAGSKLIALVEKSAYDSIKFELSKYKRALAVAKERIQRHWSGNSEDVCLEIARILEED